MLDREEFSRTKAFVLRRDDHRCGAYAMCARRRA
jgi:hypothetical protein